MGLPYQLAFVTPGKRPRDAISRKQMRHMPNRRMNARGRPQMRHLLYRRALNFGVRCDFTISALRAKPHSSHLGR